MRLHPRSYGWKFFYASALVVVLTGCLTVAIFLTLRPGQCLPAGRDDHRD